MNAENRAQNLEAELKRLSVTKAKKEKAVTIINEIVKKSSLGRLVRVVNTRAAVKESIGQISERIDDINKQLEPHYLIQVKNLLTRGLLSEGEVDPQLLKKLKKSEKKEPNKKPINIAKKEPTVTIESRRALPTLRINKKTRDIAIIEEGVIKPINIKNKIAPIHVLLALAETPRQPINHKIIEEIMIKAGSHNKTRPASNAIDAIRRKFGQTKDTFQYISTNRGKEPTYTLNMNVEVVKEGGVEETKNTIETGYTVPVFNRETGTIKLGSDIIKLSPSEFIVFDYLEKNQGKKMPNNAKEIATKLREKGFISKVSWVIKGLEDKAKTKLFKRVGIRKIIYEIESLPEADKKLSAPINELKPSMEAALNLIIDSPNILPDTLIKTLGKSTKTKELLHTHQARFALIRTIRVLSNKSRSGSLSKEEHRAWDKIEELRKREKVKLIDRIKSVFPTKTELVGKTSQVKNENLYILTREETEIILSLINVKDHTKIVFDDENEVVFQAPKWISKSTKSKPSQTYDTKELNQIRKTILEKIKRIILKNREGGQTIDRQILEDAGYILLSIEGSNSLPEGTKTKRKALTLDGFINFLLSDGKYSDTIVKTNKELYVAGHERIYRVPPTDAIDINPVKKQTKPETLAVDAVIRTGAFDRSVPKTRDLISIIPAADVIFQTQKKIVNEQVTTEAPVEILKKKLHNKNVPKYISLVKLAQITENIDGAQLTRLFPKIKTKIVAIATEKGYISPEGVSNGKSTYSPADIATLLWLNDNRNAKPRDVRKIHQAISREFKS